MATTEIGKDIKLEVPLGEIDFRKRKQTYHTLLLSSQFFLTNHLVWMIAYLVVFNKTDKSSCAGPLYNFVEFGRWVLLGLFVFDAVVVTALKYLHNHPDPQHDEPPNIFNIFSIVETVITFGFWVGSIFAISEREGCTDNSLSAMMWAYVICYAFLPCGVSLCYCNLLSGSRSPTTLYNVEQVNVSQSIM